MVRGKTQMKRIENATSRQVTFSKRRNGLLKKAFELSVLCDAEVALVIFSTRGKLFEFSSTSSINKTIERYQKKTKDRATNKADRTAQTLWKQSKDIEKEACNLEKKIENIEISKRKLMGEGLEACSIDELRHTEEQLERSLSNIRARKNQLFKEQIEKLKEQDKILVEENVKLREKCGLTPMRALARQKQSPLKHNIIDVETDLTIGPPERRGSSPSA